MRAITPLSNEESITISAHHQPELADELTALVRDLSPCCDLLRVVADRPDQVPAQLSEHASGGLEIVDGRMRGNSTVFAGGSALCGYHLIVSPRYVYPPGYVPTMLGYVERYKRKALVSVGGAYVLYPNRLYVLPANEPIPRGLPVHLPNPLALAYHAGTLCPEPDTDAELSGHLGVWAQRQHTPVIAIQHAEHWVWQHPGVLRKTGKANGLTASGTVTGTVCDWRLYSI